MSFSNIRILSSGRPDGLKVSTHSGEEIPCKSVHFTQNAGEAPVVTLVLEGVQVDIASDPDVLQKQAQQAGWSRDEHRGRMDVI